MTWHCLSEASSSIFPSSITAPVPSPIAVDDPAGVRDVRRRRAEDPLGDLDLLRVQAPGADAAEQEGVAELVLAGDRVGDVAERPVVGVDPVRRAGVDHAGDRVVPQVLLVRRRAARRGRRRIGVLAHQVAGVAAADAGRLHPPVGGEVGRAERRAPASAGEAPQISSTLATPRAVSRIAWTRIGRSSPALASSWASSRST